MGFKDFLQYLRHGLATAKAPLPYEEECERLAEAAYAFCVDRFGPPLDPQNKYVLLNSAVEMSYCMYCWPDRSYIIGLASQNLSAEEERCRTVGHEMYHRVTCRRPGLRREVWADEVMAFLTSQWFLKNQGYADHADRVRDSVEDAAGVVDVSALRQIRRLRRTWIGWPQCPDGFGMDAARLGLALSCLVSRKSMTRLPGAKSLSDWIETLPESSRNPARRVLGLPFTEDTERSAADSRRLAKALRCLGQTEAAVAELQQSLLSHPDDADTHFYLGNYQDDLGYLEEARHAWHEAARLDPSDDVAPCNLAASHYRSKEFHEAIAWYHETLRRKPEAGDAAYYLGTALTEVGRLEEARAAWKTAITFGDDEFVSAAREKLAEVTPKARTAESSDVC